MTTFKLPTSGEKLRAIQFAGRALCARCRLAGGKYTRPRHCPDCEATTRRLQEVRAWLRRTGRMPGELS